MSSIFHNFLTQIVGSLTIISSLLFPTTPDPTPTPIEPEKAAVQETPESTVAPEIDLELGTQAPNPSTATSSFTQNSSSTEKDDQKKFFSASDHEKLRKALVNIYCTLGDLETGKPLTASGTIIDPRGIILTNAHVAQYVILEKYAKNVNCVARTGSPAKQSYTLRVLYASPEWIEEHSNTLFSKTPRATGEDDYAFLLMENSVDITFPGRFDFITPETNDGDIDTRDSILLGAYPADILDSLSIKLALYAITTETDIKKLLTFGKDSIDAISTGGSYLAQKGSSGGAVVNTDGKLIGMFVTSTQEENREDRDLRAITLSHINRSLHEFGGIDLWDLLGGDVFKTAERFNKEISPLLNDILIEELRGRE